MNAQEDRPVPASSAGAASDNVRIIKRILLALLFFVVLGVFYFAQTVLIPLTLALLLSFVLSPLVGLLQRWHLPRALGSILILAAVVAAIAFGVTMLAQPARDWVAHAPRNIQAIERSFESVRGSIHAAQVATKEIELLARPPTTSASTVVNSQPSLLTSMATSTPRALMAIAEVLLLVYFFLSSGNGFLRRMVEIAPGMSEKKMVVHIAREVQEEMSRYLMTVSAINLALGAATAVCMAVLGVPNPLLWGAVATVFNFAPYVGPAMTGIGLLLAASATFDSLGHALAVPGVFLTLTITEGQLITPTIIGQRLSLDPAVVFVWLLLWGALWGIVGILLAGPLIACLRIICQHVDALKPVGVLIGNSSFSETAARK